MPTITASAPAIVVPAAPARSSAARWLLTAAAVAVVTLSGVTALLNVLEAHESAEYAPAATSAAAATPAGGR
jgi:hypothetical protein